MGQTGSFTEKVCPKEIFRSFTIWNAESLRAMKIRSDHELPDTFALKASEV